MPSMPMLSTPAFSEICSPRPASSSGTPAVTAPNKSVVRKASFNRTSMSGSDPLAALVIEIFDHRQEQEQQPHQHQHEMLRHSDAPRRAVAADHQGREEQRE